MDLFWTVVAAKLAKVWGLEVDDFNLFQGAEEAEEDNQIGFVGGDVLPTAEEYYEEME